MAFKCKNEQKLTYDDSTKSIFLQYISTFIRKLHAKNEVIRPFLRNQHFKWKVDGRWTTDNSALEKLRCISAGGANEPFLLPIKVLQLGLYEKYQQISVILITGFGTISMSINYDIHRFRLTTTFSFSISLQ